jgi:diguanylate cyclase (GGDEF)-like protein
MKTTRSIESVLAFRDGVTGLPSRDLLEELLLAQIACARRDGGTFGLLYADVEQFGHANALLGRDGADMLLRLVGERIRVTLRASDVVARIARDEFAAIVRDAGDTAAILVAEKVRRACVGWYAAGGREHPVGVSVGSSVYPADGDTVGALFSRAEAAMSLIRAADRRISGLTTRRAGAEYVLR